MQAFHIDGNKSNNHANNIGYRFTVVPLELENTGYYYIPGYPKRYINKNGEIVAYKNGEIIEVVLHRHSPSKDNNPKNITGGYLISSLTLGGSVTIGVRRHRAMLLAFKYIPDNIETLVCNHINGIPGDDRLENLEWVTRKGNLAHAYETGLRSQNRPVLARNVFTKEITEYFSVAEAARQLGCNDRGLNQILEQRPFGSMNKLGYQFKYVDDDRDWIDFEDPEAVLKTVIQNIAVKAKDCKSGKTFIFDSAGKASEFTNVCRATILFRLGKKDYSPIFGWQFIPHDSDVDFPEFTEKEYLESLKPTSFKVNCKNLLTGEELTFDSMAKARKRFNYTNLSAMLRKGKQPVLPNGWTFKYEQDDWNKIEDIQEAINRWSDTITARNYKENKIFIFDSQKQFINFINKDISPDKVRDMIRSDGKMAYKGWQLRAGEDVSIPFPEVNEHYNVPYKLYKVEYPDGVVKIMKANDVINALEIKKHDFHNRLKRNAKHISDKYPDVKVTIFKQ